ncbi:MAG: oligosaccharide flippase family protein [bacterium]
MTNSNFITSTAIPTPSPEGLASQLRWLGIMRGISMVILLTLPLILTRMMGPGGYAPFAYVLSLIAVAQQLTSVGLDGALPRFIARAHSRHEETAVSGLLRFCFGMRAVSIAVCLAVLVAMYSIKSDLFLDSRVILLGVAIAIVVRAMGFQLSLVAYGRGEALLFLSYDFIYDIVRVFAMPLSYKVWGLDGLVMAFGVCFGVPLLHGMWRSAATLRGYFSLPPPPADAPWRSSYSPSAIFRFGVPMWLSESLRRLRGNIGVLMIAFFLGKRAEAVGFFSLAVALLTLFNLLVTSLLAATYSRMAGQFDRERPDQVAELVSGISKFLLLAAVPLGWVFLLLSPWAIEWVMPGFGEVGRCLQVLSPLAVVIAVEMPMLQASVAVHQTGLQLRQAIVNLVSFAILFPTFLILAGQYGWSPSRAASVAFLIAACLSVTDFVGSLLRRLGLNLKWGVLIRQVALSVVFAPLLWVGPPWRLALGVPLVALWLLLQTRTGILSRYDWIFILRLAGWKKTAEEK